MVGLERTLQSKLNVHAIGPPLGLPVRLNWLSSKETRLKLWSYYKSLRNKVDREIKNSKRCSYNAKFSESSGNLKEMWKTINSIKCRNSIINEIIVDKVHSINSQKELQIFLIANLQTSGLGWPHNFQNPLPFYHYLNSTSPIFNLTDIQPSEELNILKKSVTNKSAGLDCIPNKLLKIAADIIAEPLCFLFDASISTEQFCPQ